MENKEKDPNFKFTDQQIDMVLEMIAKNPEIAKELLINAQDGNQEDLEFLIELGLKRGIMLTF